MTVALLPPAEAARLAALRDLGVVTDVPDRFYEDVALAASRACGAPTAFVSLVEEHEQHVAGGVGLDLERIPRDEPIGGHAILDPDRVLVVPDAAHDARFAASPLVGGGPRLRFYAGAPLVASSGQVVGALCVAAPEPRALGEAELASLMALARSVVAYMEARRDVRRLEEAALERQERLLQLESRHRELEAAHHRLAQVALHDPLTGLYNRRAFQQRLDEEIARARRAELLVSLIVIGVDRFRAYNDEHGRAAGDVVLATVATILGSVVRAQDLVFRQGGDEFSIVLPGTPSEGAAILAERLRRAIAAYPWPEQRKLSASLGVATLGGSVENGVDLLGAADRAMRVAKGVGRNRVVVG